MKLSASIILAAAITLASCSTTAPFSGAVRGSSYTIEEFEAALVAEKVALLEGEIRSLRTPEPTRVGEVKLWPFLLPKFPKYSAWRKVKEKSRMGDLVCEFHHRLYLKGGEDVATKRGFALMRDDRIIAFMYVEDIPPLDY